MAKILVIDDEENIRFAFKSFLADEGHDVTAVGNIEEGRRIITRESFELVFADIILEDGEGIEILRAVREGRLDCPVVMITGYPTIETATEAVRLGAFDYVSKPLRHQALLEVTGRALRHKALADEKERSRTQLEAIVRNVRDGIITVDKNFVITGVNEAIGSLCGLSRQAIGQPLGSFPGYFREDCLELIERTILEGRNDQSLTFECRPDDEPKRVMTFTISPLRNEQDEILGAMIAVKDATRRGALVQFPREDGQFHNMVGNNMKMRQIFSLVDDLAKVPTTVLITGETGTGKELVAAALHFLGPRREKPYVRLNCGALPENLLESELFGHVKGAFTGAVQNKIGRFEMADGGTIFLDEIGDISPGMQSRLLRVLQEGEFERVGDSLPCKVDVRVVAATNKDLREKVKTGEFREDLYYRLKVVELHMPTLRERKEDIPLLTQHFITQFNAKFKKEITSVTADVQRLFNNYPWPGNVRELEHALEHAFVISRQSVVTLDDLPAELRRFASTQPGAAEQGSATDREAILKALEKTDGNKAKAAKLLGISRQTIYRKT